MPSFSFTARQGDITHLLDTDGKVVVRYCYDAWGNHVCILADGTKIYDSASGVAAGYETHIGNLNPYRYRSYYFDTDTALYFLQTRYYDPQIGRFISQDDVSYLNAETINGLNLYAYCLNDPINRIDPNGNWSWKSFWKGVGSTLMIVCGVALCFVPGAQVFGAALIITGAGGLIGGAVGAATGIGFSAGWNAGTLLGAGIGLTISGFGIGATSVLGSLLAGYGISITSNFLEVAVSQGKKSHRDGDNFKSSVNDIIRAMNANSGQILAGRIGELTGTRIYSKFLTLLNLRNAIVFKDIAALAYLTGKAHPLALLFGYGLAGFQVANLLKAIFGDPDEDKWVLF